MEDNSLYFRAMEPEDINLVFEAENRREAFLSGETRMPYAYAFLRDYITRSLKENFLESGQLRLIATEKTDNTPEDCGILDFFNHEPFCRRAEIGIIVFDGFRHRGYGKKILDRAVGYAKNQLNLHQVYAEVLAANSAGIKLFESCGFEPCARKRDWFFANGKFVDVVGFQMVLN